MNQLKAFLFLLISPLVFLQAHETALPKVTLQLVWKHQFQFAGYYMAKEKGFYRKAGLDVEIHEYKNGVDVVKSVLEGKSTFGIDYSSVVLQDPRKVVLIGALLQSSPHVLVSLKSSGIQRIEDFKNKKIMINKEAWTSAPFAAMLRSKGVSFDEMNISKPTYDIHDLINKKVDLMNAYLSNEIYTLDKEGIAYNIWNPKEYGFDLYSDILFTSKKELQEHPRRVAAFAKASYRGWRYAFEHINETVDIILQKYNSLHKSRDALMYEAKMLKKLAEYGTEKFTTLDVSKLQRIRDIYNVLGYVPKQESHTNLEYMIYRRPSNHEFSQQESAYLRTKKVITMCIDPDWMPFESLQNGKHVGMSADYFHLFETFIGSQTHIKLVPTTNWNESLKFARERKCDILSLLMKTSERSKYLNFTKPYLKIPIVMATRMDAPFTADFHSLGCKKIALVKGYSYIGILKKQYPQLVIVEVNNIEEGLDEVAEGEVYGYVDALETIVYAMQKHHTGELKIAGKFDGTRDFHIGVRDDDPLLLAILNKAVSSIDAQEKTQIANRWVTVKYEKGIDYILVEKIVAAFGVILLIIGYFYLRLRKLKAKVEKLSLCDPLTNLYNRRHFRKVGQKAFSLFTRNAQTFSVAMLDIDNFKKINDTYGHKFGDTFLQNIADILQKHSRESDVVSRFGGEEFIMLLRNTDSNGARVHADKIRAEVEKLYVDNAHVTLSVGVSEVKKSDTSIEDVVKRADEALYLAKANGKNQVVLAD